MVGYIVGYKLEGGGNDLIPTPIKPVQDTEFIECTFKENTNDNKGVYSEGKFSRYSFEVTIEESFMYTDIQLFDYHKKPITDIVKIQGTPRYLDVMCKTKLYV